MGTDGREGARPLKDLIDASLGQTLAQATLHERAAAAWAQASGTLGKRHTRGIFVKEGAEGEDPSLIVYVDAHALIYEFSTDALLYGERLAHLGFPVRGLEFRLSRQAAAPSGGQRPRGDRAEEPDPSHGEPEVLARTPSAEEEAWAESLVEGLPAPLAKAALGAIRASLRTTDDGAAEPGEPGA